MDTLPTPRIPASPTVPLSAAGVLTFLFTDVEGSTPLWDQHEDLMRTAIARHDALLDAHINTYSGQRVKERGEGDSLFAVFTSATAAVTAALAIAQAVLAEPWPAQTPIRVRLGLHSGPAHALSGDYYGPVVNRCARLRSLAYGGQVLLSAATAVLVRDALPEGASLRALGRYHLKGLSAPEEVFQLCHPALPAAFPPLRSLQAPTHNLPAALSDLIGREREQGEVLALLAEARLVTLVGSGGAGKTRLALAVAGELVDQYADGAWVVELAALTQPELVPGAVAQVLGLREEPGRPLLQTLTDALQDRRLLLVLDNCEHLVAACAALASPLLRACPGVRILATSREGLDVVGERRWRVPSLTVPDTTHLPAPELAQSYEAVRLFVARAQERRADFALTVQNARAVAQVCARLDGIPLAIELAAARVASLGVEGVAARLDDCFHLLTGGARDVLPRHRTLRAALDWSYDLLRVPEQRLLERLAVFAGGWSLPTAEAVCAGNGIASGEILDLLDGLVNKSLVQVEEGESGEVRYVLLETVRQYGQERLAVSGGAAEVQDRHLGWGVALAEEADPHLVGLDQVAWLRQLESEHDNLRAALRWAQERGEREAGLRLAGSLSPFWERRGHLSEGRAWLAAFLEQESPGGSGQGGALVVRARALQGAGFLASRQGDFAEAATHLEESLALYRHVGDRPRTAHVLLQLGYVANEQGDDARNLALTEESLALARAVDDRVGIASALQHLAVRARDRGDYARAAALHRESLALARTLGHQRLLAIVLLNLGLAAHEQGDDVQAVTLSEESLALLREMGDPSPLAVVLLNLGNIARGQGNLAHARIRYGEALALSRTLGNKWLLAYGLEGLGAVAAGDGRPERAARLLAAATALRETIGAPLAAVEQAGYEREVAAVRATLGPDAFAAEWATGRALSRDQAVALAVMDDAAPGPKTGVPMEP